MKIPGIVENIEFLLSIAALIWLFYGPWQKFVVDVLRQNLFRLRDQIFTYAADEKLSFESPEYKKIRGRFNAMIRYAHTASWSHVMAILVMRPKSMNSDFNVIEIAGKIQNKEVAQAIINHYQQAMTYVILAIVARSLVLIAINIITVPALIIYLLVDPMLITKRKGQVERAIERLASFRTPPALPLRGLSDSVKT